MNYFMNNKDLVNEIELVSVTKVFKDVVAVNDVNIQIRAGEFFSLLGPSGCGKTTTLRIIAGLEEPTTGKIFLDGKDVTNVPAYRRDVNTVFQDYAIFPHMSVYDNVYFPLKMRKIPRKLAHPRIKNILKLVNMTGFEHRYSSQLSGGQRQRIALARALVNEPRALLLDEPLGALDFKLRVAMQEVLKDIQSRLGITFVYVTHDQTEAITMSNRIAVMCDGIVHQVGTAEEIYNEPKSAFVASFIGKMNFLQGKVEAVSSKTLEVMVSDIKIYCKNDKQKISKGDDVLVAIRPERVHINPSDNIANVLNSRLSRIVFRGDDYEITARFGKSEVRSIIAYKDWDKSRRVADDIKVGWDIEDARVFPPSMKEDVVRYG